MKYKNGFIDANTVEIKKDIIDTSEMHVSFIDQGETCLAYELTDPQPKSFGEMQLIIKDFELTCASIDAALTYWKKIEESHANSITIQFQLTDLDQVVLWNCYAAAIITYGKCFASASGRNARFPEKKLNTILNPDELAFHEHIIDLRNNWIAHGGNTITSSEYGKAILLLDAKRKKHPGIIYHATFTSLPTTESLSDFLVVCLKNLHFMRSYQMRRSQAWFDSEIKRKDLTKYYANSKKFIKYAKPLKAQ
jgi:hypothetical protein